MPASGATDPVKSGSSNSLMSMIELPDVIQSVGQQRRSGVLIVTSGRKERRFHFTAGMLCGLTTPGPGTLYHGILWCRLASARDLASWGVSAVKPSSDLALATRLIEQGRLSSDAIRDAIDCSIEEALTEVLGWSDIQFRFDLNPAPDPWADHQRELGISLPPHALLMEAVRRQDEQRRITREAPKNWDLLLRQPVFVESLPDHAAAFLQAWRDDRPVGAIAELACLPPWRVHMAYDWLLGAGVLRLADANELIIAGDRCRRQGQLRSAEGFYRRSIELGGGGGRVLLALGELAEQRRDHGRAALDYLQAAEELQVSDPSNAVLALRNAVRLGEDKITPLKQLLDIYRRMEEHEECIDILFQLAGHHEERDEIEASMAAVREAQQYGADPIRCSQVMAALALLIDNTAEALLHLEVVARTAGDQGQHDAVMTARRQMLRLAPQRGDIVYAQAKDLMATGERSETVSIIKNLFAQAEPELTEEIDIALHELLAELCPDEETHHAWLIQAYHQREDRAGVAKQLEMMLQVQQQEENLEAQADTLQRLIELGGQPHQHLRHLALVQDQRGLHREAARHWRACIRELRAAGDINGALHTGRDALTEHGNDPSLHALLADIANRSGQTETAERHFRRALLLARGSNDLELARSLLSELISIRPNDVILRRDLAEVAIETASEDRDHLLDDCINVAMRSHDLGLAIDASRQRIRLGSGDHFAVRIGLIELLRRTGRGQEELQEGQGLIEAMVEDGALDRALEAVQRLVASHPQNPDLLIQMAELHEALGDTANAVRFFRHAVPLLQREERPDRAREIIGELLRLTGANPEIARAGQMIADGVIVNWQSIREHLALASKQRIADQTEDSTAAGSTAFRRVASGT